MLVARRHLAIFPKLVENQQRFCGIPFKILRFAFIVFKIYLIG